MRFGDSSSAVGKDSQAFERTCAFAAPEEGSTLTDTVNRRRMAINRSGIQCIGAVDGKHCVIQAPINSGSDFFNYKSTFSVVLMAIVDANYNFIFADIGCQGRISDGGVFRNTSFYQKLQNNELNLPNDQSLPGRQQNMPFVFVADDAFPLQRHIMKPYPGTHARGSEKRIYNYRLSRARRIVENAFGILSAVFRVLRKPMLLQPDKASLIVKTCVYLHNYLMKRKASRKLYNSPGMMDRIEDDVVIPGQWRNMDRLSSFLPLPNTGRRHTLQCENIRKEFSDYFNLTNILPWQNNIA
ncbi:hypothetical protein MSG28_013597 [Choristoneura fumiferana]|uniref:Uncharacterized protein n=1 Tax=Choristoneura fumiferana TaxID=7141 RepID=A0ACC0K7Y5_CHOFU|nr:hypothetical protein MSG28_013597 [Choristoneura fumiferana]